MVSALPIAAGGSQVRLMHEDSCSSWTTGICNCDVIAAVVPPRNPFAKIRRRPRPRERQVHPGPRETKPQRKH